MRTNFINKHGMKLILAILLIVAVLTTSIVSAYFMISSKSDIIIDNTDNNIDGIAPTNTASKVESAPLADGEVPNGPTAFKQRYVGNDAWIAISTEAQMQNWLLDNKGKNAYLAGDITSYKSGSGAGKGHNAWADGTKLQAIRTDSIFDGCGYTITFTPTDVPNWTGFAWDNGQQYDGRHTFSLFAAMNAGIMRNIKYRISEKTVLVSEKGGNKNVFLGIVAAYNTGNMYNISFDYHRSNVQLHLENTAIQRSKYVYAGIIAGSNRGTISNCTIKGADWDAIFGADGKGHSTTAWNWSDGNAYVGCLVGESVDAYEYNNTMIAGDMRLHSAGRQQRSQGGAVGIKRRGKISGFALIGILYRDGQASATNGSVVGVAEGDVIYEGIYSEYNTGIGSGSWMAGNATVDALKFSATRIVPSQYDVVFEKSTNYYESNQSLPTNLVVTPKIGTTGSQRPSTSHVVWGVQYLNDSNVNQSALEIRNVATEVITGSFKIPHLYHHDGTPGKPNIRKTTVNILYGTYGTVDRMNLPEKTYNGNQQAGDSIVYRSLNGTEKTVNMNVATMNVLYNDLAAIPINAGDYWVSADGYYLDEAAKYIGYNPNGVKQAYKINPKNITFEINNFALDNYAKVYDTNSNGPATAASPYMTGIGSEGITFNIESIQYLNKDVGINKALAFDISFTVNGGIANINYLVNGLNVYQGDFTVDRGVITAADITVPDNAITIDVLTKEYDKFDTYNGTVTVAPSIMTTLGEYVSLNNVVAKYNSKNVNADKVVVTYELLADDYSKNYQLTATSKEFIGASITPYNMAVNWDIFAAEAFYNANGSTNVSRAYDASDSISGDLMAINKPFTTALGEIIKLKYVSAVLNSKNVASSIPMVFTFMLEQLPIGSQEISGSTYDVADANNYILDNSTVNTSAAITPMQITITDDTFNATLSKVYDGTTNYVGDAITHDTINGAGGETITLNNLVGIYNNKNVVGASTLSIVFTQTDGNYSFNIIPVDNRYAHSISASILPLSVDITEDMLNVVTSKTYDSTVNYVGETISQNPIIVKLTGGDESIILNKMLGTYAYANVKDTDNNINIAIEQNNSNFTINSNITVAASINPYTLTLQGSDFTFSATKVYDGNNNTTANQRTIAGLVGQEIILSNIVATFNSKDVATANAINIGFALEDNVVNGNYNLAVYSVTIVSSDADVISITVKTMNVEASDFAEFVKTKAYDGTDTFNGVIVVDGKFMTNIGDEELIINVDSVKFNSYIVNTDGSVRIIANISQSDTNYIINATVEFIAEITPYIINDIANTAFTVDGTKVYDGNIAVADDKVIANSFASGIGEETVILTKDSATYNSKDVATANTITITFTLSDTNYAIGNIIALIYDADITAKDITLTSENFDITANKAYDKNTDAIVSVVAGGILTGITYGDVIEVLSLDSLTANYNSALVLEANNINVKFTTANANYNITNLADGITVSGTIAAKEITVTEENFTVTKEKTYDGNNIAAITGYNIIANDESINLNDGYAATYASANVGDNIVITVNFADSLDNYNIINNSVTYSGSITSKAITVDVDTFSYDSNKIYNARVDYVGTTITAKAIKTGVVVDGIEEEITLTIGEATYDSKNAADASKINVLISQGNNNYSIVSNIDLTATVTAYAVLDSMEEMSRYTLTIEKLYDGSDHADITINEGYASINGLEGETFTYTIAAKYSQEGLGFDLNITVIVVSNDNNYTFNITSFLGSDLGKITAAAITVTVENFKFNSVRQYDGTAIVTIISYSIKGEAGEEVYLADGYRAEYDNADVGMGKTITITFSPRDGGYSFINSSVTYTPVGDEDCEITKRTVELASQHFDYSNTKEYDGTTDYDNTANPISVKDSGVVNTGVGSDTINVSVSTAPVYNSANVGNGNFITVGVSMVEHDNYIIIETANLDANVTAKAITVTVNDFTFSKTKTYNGNANVSITAGTITGVGSETITLTDVAAAFNSKDVDSANTIIITFKQTNANYTINESITLADDIEINITTYVIEESEVSATVDKSKTYDANATASVTDTVISVSTNEAVTVDTVIATYDNKNKGTNKTITLVLTITDSNYSLGFSNIEYTDGVIIQKSITVQGSDITVDGSKVYDGTADYVGAVATHGVIDGACGDDVVALVFGAIAYNDKNVATANALTVNFIQNDDNYILNNFNVAKTASISKATITVAETDITFNKSKVYDNNIDVAIVQKTINGVSNETITLGALTAKYNSKNVAEANSILVEFALSENDTNYQLAPSTFGVTGDDVNITTYVIEESEVSATVDKSKTYDANATASVTNTVISVSTNEAVTVDTAIATYDNKNKGTDKTITLVLTITDSNYSLGFSNIKYTDGVIIQKSITVQDSDITVDGSKVYDGTANYIGAVATHGVIDGACGDDVVALVFGVIAYNDKNVATANALTVNFTQNDDNYILSNFSVAKTASITVYIIDLTEDNFTFNKSKVYDNNINVAIVQGTINGVIDETITLGALTAQYNSKNVANADAIMISFALADGLTNYKLGMDTITAGGADVKITPFVITNIHVDFEYTATKGYDTNTSVMNVEYNINTTNIGFSDDEFTLASYSAAYEDKNADENKNINFTYTIDNTNYTLGEDVTSLTKTYNDGVIVRATVTPSADEFIVINSRQYTGDNSAELSATTAIKGIGDETIDIDVSSTSYIGEDFNVGNNKTIRVEFSMSGSVNNSNYDLTATYVEITDCEITQKQIEVTYSDFDITNTKVYNANRIAMVAAKLVDGVSDEKVLLVVNSALFNSENVASANSITIQFALSSANVNKNYVISNEINAIVYDTDVSISPAQLTVAYSNTMQSYRNNPNPLARVIATIADGNITGQNPVLKVNEIDIVVGEAGEYELSATTTDTNYVVANTSTLKLDIFASADGRWLIENISDFNIINTDAKYLAYNFTQTADIDMKYATMKGITGDFSGSYDGNSFLIKNAFMYGAPLFETVSGTITKLALVNIVIISYTDAKIGGIAGVVTATGVLENIVFEGSIYINNSGSTTVYVGGIAAENNGRISSAKVFADITVKAEVSYVGGIVAENTGVINAITNNGVKDLNRVLVEIIATGAGANVDAIAASNTSNTNIDVNDTLYLNNANIQETAENEFTVINSILGTAVTFSNLSGSTEAMFGTMKVIEFINAYRNDFNLKLTPNYVLEISNLRDYALIGQYNYVNIKFTASFDFHKYYQHDKFNNLLIGNITLDRDVVLDARVGGITNIFKYNN